MVPLGLQISEITKAIDGFAKLVIKFKEAPTELRRIIKAIEHATRLLEQCKNTLEEYGDDLPQDQGEFLRDKVEQYQDVLTQLQEFERKHWRLADGKRGGRLFWVFTEHFYNDRASLEDELSTVERRIQSAIIQSSWNQMLKLGRSNSLTVPAAAHNSVRASLRQHASTHHLDAQQSPDGPAARRTSPRDDVVTEPYYPSTGSRSPGSFSTNSGYSGRQPSVFSIPSARTSITQYSTGTPRESVQLDGFDPLTPLLDKQVTLAGDEGGASPVGSPRFPQSPQPFTTLRNSAPPHTNRQVEGEYNQFWRQDIFQDPGARPPTTQCEVPGTLADSYIVRTLSRNPTSLAPPPAATNRPAILASGKPYMTLHGQSRIWYSVYNSREQRLVPRQHVCNDIEVKRLQDAGVVQILFRTDEGMKALHQFPLDTSPISQTVLRVPVPSIVAQQDPRIKCWLMCRGRHSLSARTKAGAYKEIFAGSPQYSFTDEQDNLLFQSLITGCNLRSEYQVQSITLSSSRNPISENRYLQLWQKPTGFTLRYFCNGVDPNRFAEHNMDDVRRYLSTDERGKKRKWDREVNLQLQIVEKPQPRGKSPPTLRIVFPSAAERDAWLAKAGLIENG